jgi:predicted RNase H-like nuclease (RuvC/YqgF family)
MDGAKALAPAELAVGVIELDGQTLLGVMSIVLSGGFITTIIAVWKAKPERDSVVVMPWQNLTNTLGEHMRQLQSDWQRERDARIVADQAREKAEKTAASLQDEIEKLEAYVHQMRLEIDELRRLLDGRGRK